MVYAHRRVAAVLLAGIPVVALSGAAAADSKAEDAKLEAVEQQVRDLSAQIQDLKRSTADQYADERSQQDSAVKVTLDNGRPTFSSADGKFTASIRALGQIDWGSYMQRRASASLPAAYAPALSSGANFRRVYLGVQGKLFGDWSYNFNFDFGGSGGTEAPGHIQSVYLEYDGLAPFAARIGAYPAPANLEDSTASGDTLFLERNAPSDLQRNLAGGDGRDAVSLIYSGDRFFGAFSYTGNKIQETQAVFDEQQALLSRASYLVYSDPDAHWLVGANGTYVIKPAGVIAGNVAFPGTALANGSAKGAIALSDPPELTIDDNGLKLANTTALSAGHVAQWGLETAGNWQNIYGQAGFYDFEVDRAPENFTIFTAPSTSNAALVRPRNDHFTGWYLEGAWTLTGESRNYNKATGAFTPPKPSAPLDLEAGNWGAFELAGRYSDLNLNDRTRDPANVVTGWSGANKTYTYFDTVRGGDQRIWTAALNWYPVNAIKFALQYQFIEISKLQSGTTPSTLIVVGPTAAPPVLPTASASQTIQTIGLRAQVQL